jgi:hypothetical protein
VTTEAEDVRWMAPDRVCQPREALHRIEALCHLHPTLFGATFAVAASHPGVPREILAAAIKQFRRDADPYTREDVVALITSVVHGAQQAFEAVLRTRRTGERRSGAPRWVKSD